MKFQKIISHVGIYLAISFLNFPALLQAQVVNVEKERIHDHNKSGIMGKISATCNIQQNKDLLVTADINPHLQYKNKKNLFLCIAQWDLALLNKSTINNGGYIHFRYNYECTKNIKWELFNQFQYNKIWNMPLRFLAGTGPRFKILDIKKNKLYFGPLYMFELQEVGTEYDYTQYNHRLSAYLSWNAEYQSNIFFSGTLYYQPLFKNFTNYRVTGLTELNFAISPHFSFDNKFYILFDETKTADIPPVSYRYTAGLGYKF